MTPFYEDGVRFELRNLNLPHDSRWVMDAHYEGVHARTFLDLDKAKLLGCVKDEVTIAKVKLLKGVKQEAAKRAEGRLGFGFVE